MTQKSAVFIYFLAKAWNHAFVHVAGPDILRYSDSQMFEKDINTAVLQLNRWFNSNLLLLNLEKTYFLQFLTKNTKATDTYHLKTDKFPVYIV